MVTGEIAEAGGIFQRVGEVVVRWPLVVIGFWIALAAGLTLTLPPLAVVAARHQTETLPADAPVVVTGKQMAEAFHETGSGSTLLVVLTDEKGLGPDDEKTYRTLVDKLRQDTKDVKTVQDFLGTPQLREVLQSKDNKVWALPVVLKGDEDTPKAGLAYKHVGEIVKKTVANSTLTANLTGPAATETDLTDIGQRDGHVIEVGITIMVLLILLIVYRNPVTMLIPLITIGVAVATAQGVLAGLGELGLGVTGETIVFMTGVIFGVGTDYGVFLISRYHDYVRQGADSDQAAKRALASVGKVIAASAATVAVTFSAMIFCQLEIFATVGPAISICVIVAFLAAVSFLPAVLVLAGRRGWIRPRRDLTHRFWRRTGIRIVRRPKIHLVASLIVLAILASCASLARYNYDDRKTLPGSVESAVGFAALDRHLPLNSILPQYLFVQSSHDLRTSEALADIEQMGQRVAQVPDIAMVRGMTRPLGDSLEQTKATWQAGVVGDKLDDASKQIADHDGDLSRLTDGARQMAGALGDVRNQVSQASSGLGSLLDSLTSLQNQLSALSVNSAEIQDPATWAGPILTALHNNPTCDADPACVTSRSQLQRLAATRNGVFDKLAELSRQLNAVRSLAGGGPGGVRERLASVQDGANKLADGSRQLADGVQQLVDQTKLIGTGLGDASAFLLGMKNGAEKPPMSGFYIPPQAFNDKDFKTVADIFMSPDGHATRFLIQTKLNPFTTAAMDQINAITNAARSAQPNTVLADAKVSMTGMTVGLRDTRDYYNQDTEFIVAATIIIVLLILIALLRAVVAPLYLIASVLISYMSALGIGVIVFQFLLDQDLHWSAPGLTFILLVAVGADYNLLLISRIREESPRGVRSGVIRTVGSTGAVITSAGLIFAASMFGLTFASISTLVQIGFIIGAGILLDTFLVRTITVPAVAALAGRANWWPSRPTSSDGQAKLAPMLRRLTEANWKPLRLRSRTSRIEQEEQPPAAGHDEKTPTSHHLTNDTSSCDTQIRLTVPPTVTEHRRHSDATFPVGAHNRHQPANRPGLAMADIPESADRKYWVPPMKFALAAHGTRGDVEPCAAVGLELLRRGHDVRMAAPPNLLRFVESAGLAAVPYGPDSQDQLDEDFFRNFWKIQNPVSLIRAGKGYITRGWAEMSTTLTSLADGADLVLTGMIYQEVAANVAECYDIPLAALHYFPARVNGHLVPVLPSPLIRSAMSAIWWLHWHMTKEAEDAQRSELGLPKATTPASRRMMERGSLEIQAYDELCFPGLAAEWGRRRPFVGALTMELPTDADDEVASWIAAGTPPIYFGFGSMPVQSLADTVAMISEACMRLGERALVCSGTTDLTRTPHFDYVKVVGAVNHAAIFPACRAVVHHGGAGTTAAGIRAGIPTLVLWIGAEQPIWAAQVKRLKVGSARRFSNTTTKSLVADLRRILAPRSVTQAREIAKRMTKPAASVTTAADLLEETVRMGKFDRSAAARPPV